MKCHSLFQNVKTEKLKRTGRFPEGGNGNLLQYSSLENSMDRGVLWAKVHRITKSLT